MGTGGYITKRLIDIGSGIKTGDPLVEVVAPEFDHRSPEEATVSNQGDPAERSVSRSGQYHHRALAALPKSLPLRRKPTSLLAYQALAQRDRPGSHHQQQAQLWCAAERSLHW
jgi:hypothetical protein